MSALRMTDREMERNRAAGAAGRAAQTRDRAGRMEDYLFIGGTIPDPGTWLSGVAHGPTARELAARLGVTPRTIQRYRKYLREAS